MYLFIGQIYFDTVVFIIYICVCVCACVSRINTANVTSMYLFDSTVLVRMSLISGSSHHCMKLQQKENMRFASFSLR